jgi:hypothetical protein
MSFTSFNGQSRECGESCADESLTPRILVQEGLDVDSSVRLRCDVHAVTLDEYSHLCPDDGGETALTLDDRPNNFSRVHSCLTRHRVIRIWVLQLDTHDLTP